MAISKKNEFTDDDIKMAELAKALSHPARIAILRLLAERQQCICGDIVEELPLAQSTVSQHLKELKQVELIESENDGPRSCYCLNQKTLEKFSKVLSMFVKNLKDCCK